MYRFNSKAVHLAKLSADETANLANFNCGDNELNRFLLEDALDEQEQRSNRTYLVYYLGEIAAYCSLCTDSIRLKEDEAKDDGTPRVVAPAIKIARLARDIRYRGLGIGRFLVHMVYDLANRLTDDVGVRYLTIDAYPDRVPFYLSLGFKPNLAYSKNT